MHYKFCTVFVLSGRLFLFSLDQSNMRPKTAGERNESDMMEKAKKAMVQTEDPVEKIRLDLVKKISLTYLVRSQISLSKYLTKLV